MSAICISDLHLDASVPNRLDALGNLLVLESEKVETIYVLGDLVEAWVGDDDDSQFTKELRSVLVACNQRVAVYLMHGNRDFLIGKKFEKDTGARLIDDPIVVEVEGRRVLLAHGDAFCTKDQQYQQMRNLFRSVDWQRDILSRSLQERIQLANEMREQSRQSNANKSQNIMDVTDEVVRSVMQENECDILIHGHTHRPGIHRLDQNKTRYVLGDWNRCGWLARIEDGGVSLECFPI
ncbi:MAG: UDP-2,3-diacylglucosamine diphosphatase [Pseudomonadota bacterium]|nr:UDP-2,3-diacylglucosamine diphosphatase [Pseudomonadota bacterium]